MCQEIYIENIEAIRSSDTCWCPLSDCYGQETNNLAFLELGKMVYEGYLEKVKNNPDSGSIKIEVEVKRW